MMLAKTSSQHRRLLVVVALSLVASSCGGDEIFSSSIDMPDPNADTPDIVKPLTTAASGRPLDIEGHRGTRGLKPENTLPAFETALDLGVSTLELDMHLTSDNQIVVWHDARLGADKCRFIDNSTNDAGGSYPGEGITIASQTLEQLDDIVCDLNPDPSRFPDQDNGPTALAGSRYQPATLTEFFAFVANYAQSEEKTEDQRANAAQVEFNIETKREVGDPSTIGDDFDGVTPGRFEIEVLAAVEAAGVGERVIIQSFDHRSLWAIRSVNADIRLSALTSSGVPDLGELAANGATIWSPNFQSLNPDMIDRAHAAGLLVIPWTVNERSQMNELVDMGVDGLISDRPDIALG